MLDEKVKEIRLKSPIEQQFDGSGGVFRQNNIVKRRVFNLPQWRELCESTDHQPPARRGEVRTAGHTVNKRKAKPKKSSRKKAKRASGSAADRSPQATRTAGSTLIPEAANNVIPQEKACENCWITHAPLWRKDANGANLCNACGLFMSKRGFAKPIIRPAIRPACLDNPPSLPVQQIPSPEQSSAEDARRTQPLGDHPSKSPDPVVDKVSEMEVDQHLLEPIIRPETPHSPPEFKRKRAESIQPDDPDESEADSDDCDQDSDFQNFDYRISNAGEYTVERCKELERTYWKTVMFNNPMYGADAPGSLFDGRTDVWNVAKLDNLLCRIGKTIPGVNSAYLYLGMWKATFSWHVEVLPY